MEYLATPLDGNTPSPSELNGHKFNSFLPNISNSKHSDVLVKCHDVQLQHNTMGIHYQSCLLAARLGTEIISLINLMLV